ncbi:MAG: hypothetical protein K9L26_03420 [Candidatus Izimaplasma sp.]|nr:hypothetical protein [Candidatus Izimaplasma bacterium]
MNKKCLIKFEHEDFKDLMHYVVYDGDVVVLSRENSEKVKYARKHGFLFVSFNIDSHKFEKLDVKVIIDKDYVKKVYDYMIQTNNAYFKDGTEELCAIKLLKNQE